MVFISPIVDIALVCVVMVCISQTLQRKLVDRKKLKRDQQELKEKQKRVKELMQKEDPESKKELEKLQTEMLELMASTMKASTKPMFVSLPLFFVVYGLLAMVYSGSLIELPFPVLVLHRSAEFFNFPSIPDITSQISWLWWYVYCSVTTSIIISLALKAYEKSKENQIKK
ncbi:MAG: DUF106 domain-containing protein [Candidatus Diapherotrites archaeon]|nr:DUF106 domain-containing protein [Candidatus Diapherotrites archaeon]